MHLGVFRGVHRAYREGRLDDGDAAWLLDEIDWFNHHLPAPRTVDPRAVFWFRSGAGQPLSRIWALVHLAESNGIPVRLHRTHRPGIVVYADNFQVAAIPWRDTFDTRAHSRA